MNEFNFDCRRIRGGLVCDHLLPWGNDNKSCIGPICTCKALNAVVFPTYTNFGKITQKLVGIKPLFDCPVMQELRLKGEAPQMMCTITKNGIE